MPQSPEIEQFWSACRDAVPGIAADARYSSQSFGDDPALSRRLLELIAAGDKTGTFTVDWQFDEAPGQRPRVGDYRVITDHAGTPGALVRITAVEVVPFDAIDEAWVQCEGPALRRLDLWRRVHWDYWSPLVAGLGREPAGDMPILCQRFELVHVA